MITLKSFKDLENELTKLYTDKGGASRASLFNFVIWTPTVGRQNYLRHLVDKVTERFPCRLFFVIQTPDKSGPLQIKVSVNLKPSMASDFIEILAPEEDIKKIPSLILPHLIPDLPLYILWGEDPSNNNPLFSALEPHATRIIYDSSCVQCLSHFAKTTLEQPDKNLRDVNWTVLTGWRNLISRTLDTPKKNKETKTTTLVSIEYKGENSVQARFLMAWLIAKYGIDSKAFSFSSKEGEGIEGDVLSCVINSPKESISIVRNNKQALTKISTEEFCQLPQIYPLLHAQRGFTFWREILFEPNSPDYSMMLHTLREL